MAMRKRAPSPGIAARGRGTPEECVELGDVTETECPHSADDALEPSQNRLRNVNRSIVMPPLTLPQAGGSDKLAIDSGAPSVEAG
jgi:hypothetical protein